jgi:hypothetical protein
MPQARLAILRPGGGERILVSPADNGAVEVEVGLEGAVIPVDGYWCVSVDGRRSRCMIGPSLRMVIPVLEGRPPVGGGGEVEVVLEAELVGWRPLDGGGSGVVVRSLAVGATIVVAAADSVAS